jgi:hypothetical protein
VRSKHEVPSVRVVRTAAVSPRTVTTPQQFVKLQNCCTEFEGVLSALTLRLSASC